jgi:tRNA1Val (adenine37-N6)-methyltransferase
MKVGTDSVLLGCWADTSGARNILEIGTGCGVIALMLAQRSPALIDAIDIDPASAGQAAKNFAESPWNERLSAKLTPLNQFASETVTKYDLVITNPPFFTSSLRSPKENKNLARHQDHTGRDELLSGARKLLKDTGKFSIILPSSERNSFCGTAVKHLLSLNRKMNIITRQGKQPERVMLEFSLTRNPIPIAIGTTGTETQNLIIRDAENSYTLEYREFTKDFYISLK